MKFANVRNRWCLLAEGGAVDLEAASGGLLPADPAQALERWSEVVAWIDEHAAEVAAADAAAWAPDDLGAPVPGPRQIFAIGLNYKDHAAEAGLDLPDGHPVVFAKFPSSIVGPEASVELPSEAVDFEAELVVVIGVAGYRISQADAWDHVAGLTVGQDLSERLVQWRGPSPQFSLGKSYPGFSPIGPAIATAEEFADLDDIAIGCTLNGEQMQRSSTRELVFTIPELVEQLSAVTALLPGDLIFTGTPAGIGWTREPRVTLQPGDRLVTHAEGIGELATHFTSP